MFQENQTPLDQPESTGGLRVEETAIIDLRTTGKWGKFISIATFVFMGVGAIGILFGGVSTLFLAGNMAGAGGGALVAFSLLIAGLGFAFGLYLNYKLYTFSVNAIKAADLRDSRAMTESISSLSTLFKVYGVFFAIILGFYALMLVFAILGGAAGLLT